MRENLSVHCIRFHMGVNVYRYYFKARKPAKYAVDMRLHIGVNVFRYYYCKMLSSLCVTPNSKYFDIYRHILGSQEAEQRTSITSLRRHVVAVSQQQRRYLSVVSHQTLSSTLPHITVQILEVGTDPQTVSKQFTNIHRLRLRIFKVTVREKDGWHGDYF